MSEFTYTSLFYTSSPDQRVIMSASHLSTNIPKIKLAFFLFGCLNGIKMKHDKNQHLFPERQLNQLKYKILLCFNLFSPSTWIRNAKITQRQNITKADLCKWN